MTEDLGLPVLLSQVLGGFTAESCALAAISASSTTLPDHIVAPLHRG
jgi:hypothetical protein